MTIRPRTMTAAAADTTGIPRVMEEAISMTQNGVVNVTPLVSHTVTLQESEAGLDPAENDPDRMKLRVDVAGS